jgi:hypothetical protein
METKMKSLSKLFLSCTLLVACGGGGGSSPDAGSADAPPAAIDANTEPDALVPPTGLDAVCLEGGVYSQIFDKLSTCNTDFIRFNSIVGTDLLKGAEISALCYHEFSDFVDDGTVTVDDSKIQECLNYVTATPCIELSPEQLDPTPCGDVFVGTLAMDSACDIHEQCQGDSFCQDTGDTCGLCKPRKPLAAACTENDECAWIP